ncbi:MAG: hypothetical protein R2806_24185 [Saprospiraceae bacterium]
MRQQPSGIWIIVLLGLWVLPGCTNWSLEEVNLYDAREVAVPLFQTRFTMPEALTGGTHTVVVGTDGSVALEYSSQEIALTASDLFPVLPVGFPIPLPDTVSRIPVPTAGGWSIQRVKFKSTRFVLSIRYQTDQPLDFWLEAPNATQTGDPWQQHFTLPVHPSADNWQSPRIDLDGTIMDLPNGEILLKYYVSDQILPDPFTVTATFTSIDFYEISGTFARTDQPIPGGELPIDVFENWQGGDFAVDGPALSVSIRNSFGIPVSLYIDQLIAVDASGNASDLVTTAFPQPLPVAFPGQGEQGSAKNTEIVIDPGNSNIQALIQEQPVRVIYQVHGVINPDLQEGPFFALDSSQVMIDSRLKIPLAGTLSSYQGQDTFPLSVPEYQGIQEATIRWTTTNEVPLALTIRGVLHGDNDVVLGELWQGWANVASGAVNGQVSKEQTDLVIDPNLINQLAGAAYLVIYYEMKTTGSEPVRVYADQQIECEVGLKLTVARE